MKPSSPMPTTGFEIALVSDHAVLRYIERRHGVDVEALREIIRDACREGVRYGASAVIDDGVKFVLEGDRVVTCLKREWPAWPKRKELL
ncbi:hypothetical protein [Martelella radicis]|uniref:Benzoyl-CoA reductase/2-hydroxyglutaryl-CoA dehydratase subunit BcrC/BadD/HgdB n=1 Tax=Martelella radicis TaxID=1397476 RepID=A0A7W6PAZ5_9HYPH|nr:hypothetical protein [Martelella radicis]MBB4122936.1 benzoyl-CoA reductase/2-hydroxyglutaryl-CoA dehydratase subunit BcrC/BadD/HgdB [Martelella radicis]